MSDSMSNSPASSSQCLYEFVISATIMTVVSSVRDWEWISYRTCLNYDISEPEDHSQGSFTPFMSM